jgi:WASH complex subunit strumpellin
MYNSCLGSLISRRVQDQIDGVPFVVGIQTLLHQFHPEIRNQLMLYLGQYVKSYMDAAIR